MTKSTIEILIAKYCARELNASEAHQLQQWIEESKSNRNIFKEYLHINQTVEQSKKINLIEKELLWRKIRAKTTKRKLSNPRWQFAAAAILLLLIGLPVIINNSSLFNSPANNNDRIRNSIEIGTDKAKLTLEDGTEVVLNKGESLNGINFASTGEELTYKKDAENSSSKTEFNYLTIPRGGQFVLNLSDGTKVWLNSESQLKYPTSFANNAPRQVELLYGEAYFDVSPSSDNNGLSFKVLNPLQSIEVIGTEFNVRAYKDENEVYTTLVEGKVLVENENHKAILNPNDQSIIHLDSNEKAINVIEVDINSEIAWMKGFFSFKHKSLKDISKTLMRWYDVAITFENKDLETVKFKGNLSKYQDIEEILRLIKSTNYINDYIIKENSIIIK
ncbi:FecR family protein [Tamlana fucoidanivorans]|uniref:FecR family protein n=1 Tax=Allotamlana fucoidanivorans TaxID=2583814 RepID=A0A5C4SSK3_9FLAO|nr:FecR family protein [Tamlana fucoidanivorans]TNJ46957.1 FecR family protein [Tamlana fucoidanivorans]